MLSLSSDRFPPGSGTDVSPVAPFISVCLYFTAERLLTAENTTLNISESALQDLWGYVESLYTVYCISSDGK